MPLEAEEKKKKKEGEGGGGGGIANVALKDEASPIQNRP